MTGLPMRRLWTSLTAAFFLAALPSISPAQSRRIAHTSSLLTTGDLLVAGGVSDGLATLPTVEIVALSRGGDAVPAAPMTVARASHTATVMANGCVLVAGGNTNFAAPAATNSLEVYNPATGLWTSPGNLTLARYNHTATLLNDGRVLICGGQDGAGTALPAGVAGSCDIYTPTSCTAGSVAAGANMLQARYNHTATLLKDGKVWFAGGRNIAAVGTGGYLPTTERYVPDPLGIGIGSFQSASPLIEARAHHTATLTGDGKALVVGGYNGRNTFASLGITETAEIYDPVSNSVTPAAVMSARRQSHASALKADGSVVALGGLGNITTTYLVSTGLNTGSLVFASGSDLVTDATGGVVFPTATVNAGTAGLIDLDFLLSKPVFGQIKNGEIWLSSPMVLPSWGAVRFVPASETNPAVGLRINLAGRAVDCREPRPPVANNCGNIQTAPEQPAPLSQFQGQVIYYPLIDINNIASAGTSGNLFFNPATIDTTTTAGTLTAASNFTTTLLIQVDAAFIGRTLLNGTVAMDGGTIRRDNFTATLTGASVANVIGNPVVNADGELALAVNFTNVLGDIEYTAADGSLNSGFALAAGDEVALTMTVNYRMNGADLAGETLVVNTSTVVIRRMIFADSETYDPKANSWTLAPPEGFVPGDHRWGHTATLLADDAVYYVGGAACSDATCSNEVASATTTLSLVGPGDGFTAAGNAAFKRALHTATLLPDGTILAAGGTNGPSILSSAEIFNPATETFSPTSESMRYVRDLHTATLLPNGRVLIAGGFTTNAASTGSTNTSEIYYPDTKVFIETAPMISSRSNHSAVMLPDGRVFVAGGFGTNSLLQDDVPSDTAEIYISTQGRWIPAANMPAACERAIHATVQLKDGRILLIGGINGSGILATSARYDPALNTWDCASVPSMPSALRSHTATLLFDGRVLVAGGNDGFGENNVSFIYNPVSNTWEITSFFPLTEPRFNHSATLLPNGSVMISGGSRRFGEVPIGIEVFHVPISSWVTGIGFAGGARAFHTMTLALNNKVYGIGGGNGTIGGAGTTLYNAAEAGYFTASPDSRSKDAPPSFRQSTITVTSASPFLPNTSLTVVGNQFRGGTEAAGGGAASANSSFNYPRVVLQQVDGSGGSASQSNGGFAVDLTTQIALYSPNFATMNTSVTVALPLTTAGLPYGWYALRTGANAIYSEGKLLQAGPAKPTTAPSGIAGAALGVSSMSWTWNAIAGVDGYNVYNATSGVFLTTIPATGSPTYLQTGLAPSATTSISIAAYTLTGDGPLTAGPTTYTVSTCPVNVTIASVTFSDLLLYWGFNGNASPGTVYEVTQSSDNFATDTSTPVPRLFNLTTNFTIISNLSANTTYFFRVQAINLIGLPSSYSAVVSTRTRAPVTQPTVSGRTTTSIDWRWADAGGVTNYRVYNATNSVLLGTPSSNLFTEVGLGTNTIHSIRVSAVTNAGEGPLSPSASAYTAAATPGPFNPVISQISQSSFSVNWTNNGNPLDTRYDVTITEFASDGSVVANTTAEPTPGTFSQVFGGLIPSTLYGYSIIAVNGDDLASENPPAVAGSTYTYPAPPVELIVTETAPTSISVAWERNNNSSSATYQVTYSTDGFTLHIATAVPLSAKYRGDTATITGLVTGATYSILVLASNPYGQLSQFSNMKTTRTFNGGAPTGSLQGPMFVAANSAISGTLGNLRDISLRAAAQTFPSDVIVRISPATGTLCSSGTNNLAFEIVAIPELQPSGSLYFSFDFLPGDLGGIPASRALLLRYDPGSGTCVPLETAVDTTNGRMTARINHFSLFQVGQVPLSTTAETARVFPNPYYTGRDGYVTIDNVPPGARVRIFTLRGEQVLDVKANSTGLLTWSGTNGSGRAVATGVYLVMVESGGSKKILKLAVIR
ncbi:MAG: kelch repeat-containing protein [Elusimicrobiota bacterium]|nr:kelch repeat-containing protein [Elusimicrobiota bacterium]